MSRFVSQLLLSFFLTAACFAQINFTTIASFNGANGSEPTAAPLLADSSGNLWGMTQSGGTNNAGTVYEIAAGQLSSVYNFCSLANCADGSAPVGGLIIGPDGNFWGTTSTGGAKNCGTLFDLTSAGALKTIHSFCATKTDGANPRGTPYWNHSTTESEIYVSTFSGGANNAGTLWIYLSAKGESRIQYSFEDGASDEKNPIGPAYPARTVLGIASAGGISNAGAIYELYGNRPEGGYEFCQKADCADGSNPGPYLSSGTGSDFFGVTESGGAYQMGTLFLWRQDGGGSAFTSLYSFCSLANCADGAIPTGGVAQDPTTQIIYGTTSQGGVNQAGTIFQFSANKVLTTLYSLCSLPACADGENPAGSLLYLNGTIYGTTSTGGANGMGTVYSFSIP
jgi:uncharacterized repeat protein (TIGR03803 family)